ncbi:MAG: hypothetical protein WC383_12215 [Gammaproteobacteria bacterium]|jgi:hypothetical protein
MEKTAVRGMEAPQARAGETYTIKGGSQVIWGTSPTFDKGTVIAHDVDHDAKYEVVENEAGAVTGIVIYDTETQIKLTIIAKSGSTEPEIGTTLTVGTVEGVVLKSALRAANKQLTKYEVTAHKWANLSLT